MIVVMETDATREQIEAVIERIHSAGLHTHISGGEERTIVGVVGTGWAPDFQETLEMLPGVDHVQRITKPYKLASREFHRGDSIIQVGDVQVGGREFVVMAGPCSVESREQILTTAEGVRQAGARMLRGGAFKPRTSPYSFQGLGLEGLKLLAEARERTGLPVVTEVMDISQVEQVCQYADVLQIGARNMANFALLREVGKTNKPVLLKRGMAATIEEWVMAAEYIISAGNWNVILCERGIRTFEPALRNTLDLSAVPYVKRISHLPVVVDPSHGTGKWYLVKPLALAAAAVGADGLIVEVHPHPDTALSDGAQSLTIESFAEMMASLRPLVATIGRELAPTGALAAAQ